MVHMLARLVSAEPDLESVGELTSAGALVEEVLKRHADVAVIDLTMPGTPPLDAIRDLSDRVPTCRVIAFSGYDDAATVDEALGAGAYELVSKHGSPSDILHAIRRVCGAVERGAPSRPRTES
jgi:DNA-binding NarL/FixJ family response regulator